MSEETKALNRISTALGGEAKVQKKEILNEIAENVNGSGGGGGSSQFMVVTITGSGNEFTCDKTYQQIKDAVRSGMIPIAKYYINSQDQDPEVYYFSTLSESGGSDIIGIQFINTWHFSDEEESTYTVRNYCFNIRPDDTIKRYYQ